MLGAPGAVDAVLDYDAYVDSTTYRAVEHISDLGTTSKQRTDYRIDDDRDVAVVGYDQLTSSNGRSSSMTTIATTRSSTTSRFRVRACEDRKRAWCWRPESASERNADWVTGG